VDDGVERWFRRRLGAVVALAAVWRLAVLAFDKWHQPLLLNDSIYYSGQAIQLANGIWFREIFVDQPGAEHGPLTSTLLATVSWLPDPQGWQRLVTVICGIVTVWWIGVFARDLATGWVGRSEATAPVEIGHPERVGVVAAAIAAGYPNLWMNDGLIMSESVSVLTVVVALIAALRAVRMPTAARLALLGVACGVGALARSELALLAPGFALVVVVAHRTGGWRALGRAALIGGVAAATVAPWVGFNLQRFERPTTLTTNDGTTLLGSYCDGSFHGPNAGGWSLACVVQDPEYSMDEEPSVRSERQRGLAVDYARAHRGELPRVVVARVARTLDLYGLDSLVAQDVGEERYRWASWAGIVAWWLLAPLSAVGWVLLGRRPPGGPEAAEDGPEVGVRALLASRRERWLLVVPAVGVFVTTVVFYGAHRIRSSLEPSVVVAAAAAICWWWSTRRARPVSSPTPPSASSN
jgi:hypothetical protein